jgi:hypothetical protein
MKDYWNNLFNYIKQNSNENILSQSNVIIDRGTLGHMTDYNKGSDIEGTFHILLKVLKVNYVPYIWLPNTAFSTDFEVVKKMLYWISDEKGDKANEVIKTNKLVIKKLGRYPYLLEKQDDITIKLGDDTWNFWAFNEE